MTEGTASIACDGVFNTLCAVVRSDVITMNLRAVKTCISKQSSTYLLRTDIQVKGPLAHRIWNDSKVRFSACVSDPRKGTLIAAPDSGPFCTLYLSEIVSAAQTITRLQRVVRTLIV